MSGRSQIWIIVVFHIALASVMAWFLNIWSDEASTLYATSGNFGFVLEKAVFYEWQPPLYHLLLAAWRTIDSSIFFARCFSIVCTSLSILVIHATARQFGVKQPLFAAALFSFHPFAIYLATEIRLYGFATLVSALLLWTAAHGYGFLQGSNRAWPHTLFSVLGLYTNILLSIPLIAQAVAILVLRPSMIRRFVVRMLCVGVAFVPMLWLQLSVAERTDMPYRDNSIKNLVMYVLGSLQYLVFPVPRSETTIALRIALLLLLATLSSVVIYRNRRYLTDRHGFIAINLIVTALVLPTVVYLGHLARGERYTYILVVPAIMAWAMILELISNPWLRRSFACLSLLLCVVSLVAIYRPMAKTGDWIRVARYLETSEGEDQLILVFPSEVEALLNYYYSGGNQIVPIPEPQRFDRFVKHDFRIPDRAALEQRFDSILRQVRQFKLVTFDPAIYGQETPDPLNFAELESFLAENFQEANRRQFFDATVRSYERVSQ